MDAAVAIPIRDIEAAIGREGDVAGVIERLAWPMALADLLPYATFEIAEEDAMRVAVDDGEAAIRHRRDLVGIDAELFAPTPHEAAISPEHDDAGPRRIDGAFAAQQDVDESIVCRLYTSRCV